MKYNNGKFKIMQITDIQEIPKVSSDTMKLLNKANFAEGPDLLVLTGDKLKGYSSAFEI